MREPPHFDRTFLRELTGGAVLQAGERLYASHQVLAAEWSPPILSGEVREKGQTYRPVLNLRSTVFVESGCNCSEGPRRRVCAHVVAVALHFEAMRVASLTASAGPAAPAVLEEAGETALPEGLQSIRLDEVGTPLRLLVFLPPNLEEAADRQAIVVKLDAAVGRQIVPLSQLSRTQSYAIQAPQLAALRLVESWCGGKLASIVQLTSSRLRALLDALVDEPVVYWVKRPQEPIAWEAGCLPGVHSFLKAASAEEPEPTSTSAGGATEASAVAPVADAREPSRPNPRRLAEAGRPSLFTARPGDYPAAPGRLGATAPQVASAMEAHSERAIVIDGSPNFLAVRLPMHDEGIQPLRELLKSTGFQLEPSNRKWWLRDRHKTLNFLAAHWQDLELRWRACFTENFKQHFARVERSRLVVEAKAAAGTFSLEVTLSGSRDELGLRRALAGGKHYIEETDERDSETGSPKILLLDKQSLGKLHEIERAVSRQADRPFTPSFSRKLEAADLVDVESLIDEVCEGWQPPEAWRARSAALKQVAALDPAPIRTEFDALLRGYQRIGVAWLWHLYRHELGGILADEMGLGKTLQALALIECIRASDTERPALVVCPASLVENWLREAARFAPQLRAIQHHGSRRERDAGALADADLIITSYGTLRQDVDLLAEMEWGVVIGDEAQHIKNRRSQNAQTLTRLRSRGRFLLTGTPVENSLDDLLSLFAFLMPGYLDKAPATLSVEDRAWHAKRQLQRAAAYILRRTKQAVAPELPAKIEKTFFCELGERQARFYQETLERTRKELFELEMSGATGGRVQFAAFKELLRLRQVCVDPRILDETYAAEESAKLAAFEEILDECLDNGSRLLVFSSFVSALQLLAGHLAEKGHRFCYLDGQTRNRLAVCDTFNHDSTISVFLISLKAGGTGLNLTGADTVLHYDPWWNPAAEAQATDRAHRIGQKRVVTSIKLIAANTVEEKVVELQAKKAELLAELFEESAAANAKVSIDEIRDLIG